MRRQRRSFSPGFKHDVASLVLVQGYSIAEAGRAVDVHKNTLRKWAQRLDSERSASTPKSKALTPDKQRIQELKARVNRPERNKAMLKKAAALLISDDLRSTH